MAAGFDRDLGIAGRAMIRKKDNCISQELVHIDRPSALSRQYSCKHILKFCLVLRIPTLAIHLERQESFSFNKETQLFPIAGMVAAELSRVGRDPKGSDQSQDAANQASSTGDALFPPLKAITQRHHPYLVELIASELSVQPQDVVDFEMLLFDTQKACLGGLLDEFIFSARLDNLNMSFCAIMGLIDSVAGEHSLRDESSIRLIALFDHEEIGSTTAHGADSNILPSILRRLSVLPASNFKAADSKSYNGTEDHGCSTAYEQSLATSFLISADMAHSVNPNYTFKYESDHRPEMNKGPVIKINANARYATNSPGIALLHEVARQAGGEPAEAGAENGTGVPLQLFVVRNDSSCGSTIGPMLSASLGVRTLDLGNPQLSMHSIRETGGTNDVEYAIRLFSSFFQHYSNLSKKILVD
jgi:aspartyl aminopeptidase